MKILIVRLEAPYIDSYYIHSSVYNYYNNNYIPMTGDAVMKSISLLQFKISSGFNNFRQWRCIRKTLYISVYSQTIKMMIVQYIYEQAV